MHAERSPSPWQRHAQRHRQQRDDKRAAVVQTAARLFARHGFQATSLDDIAASLGVTKPTLYHYIANKEEILFACAQHGVDALLRGIEDSSAASNDWRDRLERVMRCYADIVTSDHGLCVIRVGEEPLSEARRRELRDLKAKVDEAFQQLIAGAVQAGAVVPCDPAMAAYSVVGALSAIGRWYRPDEHSPAQRRDAVDHAIRMLMRGVLDAPPGPETPGRRLSAQPPSREQGEHRTMRRELHFGDRLMRCFDDRPRNLADMLAKAVSDHPASDALVCGEQRLTWRELHHAAARCAAGLAQRGVQPGDRVALMLPNQAEFVIVALACAWRGAVLMPLSHRIGAVELAYALQDAEACALVCLPEQVGLLPSPDTLPTLRLRLVAARKAPVGFEPLAELMRSEPMARPHDAAEEDMAVLMYTSGTTGRPKGSMLTHLNIAHSVLHFEMAMGIGPEDRALVAVPLSHVTGLVAQLYTQLHTQGCLVLMPQFKAADAIRLMAAERVTHTIMVPAMYNLCLLQPDLTDHDLSAWRLGAYGGAAMPTATIRALAERLPALTLMNAYGATETCSPATIMPAGDTAAHRDSVGLPVPCGEILIVDEHGRELPRGEIGELWIGGPMVVPGYWRNAAATASEFSGGYWRSGDIGMQDDDGYVRILDRRKDVINRGGYKIFSVTVENALAEHPAVIEAALVGVPCTVLGERVHAYVCVRQLDESTQASALAAFCSTRVADYAVPETWTIGTEPLPRNANGKLMKRALRESLHAALS